MKITDKEALKEIKTANSGLLWETVDEYPENERDGRSDLQFLADEVSYIVSCYSEDGHVFAEDLQQAQETVRETRGGRMPWYCRADGTPYRPKYRQSDIEIAKSTINEYKRLKSCLKRLNGKGYYGKWA